MSKGSFHGKGAHMGGLLHYHHKSNAGNSPSLFLPSRIMFIPAAVYIIGLNDTSLAKAFETGYRSQGLNWNIDAYSQMLFFFGVFYLLTK